MAIAFGSVISVASFCQERPCEIPNILSHLESFSACPSVVTEDDLLKGLGPGCVSVEQDWTEDNSPGRYYIVHLYLLHKENLWCWAVAEGGAERKIITLGISSTRLSRKKCCSNGNESILPAPFNSTLLGVMLGDTLSQIIKKIGSPQRSERSYLGQTGPWKTLQYYRDAYCYKFYIKKGVVFAFAVELS